MTDSDPALSAANYSAPTHVASNTDIQAQIAQAVQQAVQQALADQASANAPRVLSPEEAARASIDNRGSGLGIEERLAELYQVIHHLAQKLGV